MKSTNSNSRSDEEISTQKVQYKEAMRVNTCNNSPKKGTPRRDDTNPHRRLLPTTTKTLRPASSPCCSKPTWQCHLGWFGLGDDVKMVQT